MINFTVYGNPVPKGSTKAFVVNGRACTTNANPKTKAWQGLISSEAQRHRPDELYDGAVGISLLFYFQRPASVSEKKRPHMTVKPDSDKLIRSALDGLTGIIFTDDARVTHIIASKHYGTPRVEITVWEVEVNESTVTTQE